MIPVTQSLPPNKPATECVYSLLGAVPVVHAPWHYAALAQIRSLESQGQNRPGQGDLRIAERASSQARQMLNQMDISEAPTPAVASISGGGVAISWNVGRREVQLSVFSDGDVVFLKTEDDVIVNREGEEHLDQAHLVAGLKWLLAREA